MLQQIARCDYEYGVEENFAALKEIWRTHDAPAELPWFPCEVLELTRWSDSTDRDSLIARAFACAVLCGSQVLSKDGEMVDSLVQLLDACLSLGLTETELLGRFLTSCALQIPSFDICVFLAPFALLVVAVKVGVASDGAASTT